MGKKKFGVGSEIGTNGRSSVKCRDDRGGNILNKGKCLKEKVKRKKLSNKLKEYETGKWTEKLICEKT